MSQHTTRWGTLDEAAEALGVSKKTIRRLIATGTIPARRFSPRIVRVSLDELDQAGEPVTFLGERK